MGSARQISICPILWGGDRQYPDLPLKIADSLYFADVSDLIQETTFRPLAPLFYSESEVGTLEHIRYALVRDFECNDQERSSEDEESGKLLYQLYLGLKVIRPFAGRYQVFHYDMTQSIPRLPRGSRNDYPTILCDCELLNSIRWIDLQELVTVAPSLLSIVNAGTMPISQAINNFEIGYRADFLNVRHLLWVVGLDALFTSREWKNRGADLSAKRIADFLGPDFQIYSDGFASRFDSPIPSSPPLGEVLSDIYKLRNDFAHGTWPDKQWAGQIHRRSADSTRDIFHAEMLCEGASSVLRGCLRKILTDVQLVAMFNEKATMNAHFAARGLIRKRKKNTHGTSSG
jgi:hypothetical protein